MKKNLLLAAVIIIFAGCSSMDRKNPTDPQAANYGGWTYLGEIGSFTGLSDFTVTSNPEDSILAVDKTGQKAAKYLTDGTNQWVISQSDLPAMNMPGGICELGGYCYIIENQDIEAFFITTGATSWWSNATITGDKILSHSGALYVATSDPPGVKSYTSDVYGNTYSSTGTWIINKGEASCNTCMSYISDMAVNPVSNEIMLVDRDLKRISIFTDAGAHVKNIYIGSDISGVAGYGNTLYVPSTDGIRRINYSTGALIDTIANYGEGNGRVMKPGPIELYKDPADNKCYIFVGADTFIKVFEIGSFE
jgi:hypothetical protein